jgi:hypothetical protein
MEALRWRQNGLLVEQEGKYMQDSTIDEMLARLSAGLALLALFALVAFPLQAQKSGEFQAGKHWLSTSSVTPAKKSDDGVATPPEYKMPAGTILPVVLRTSFSFDKCKAGQILHGKIAQDVPLPNGSNIRKGSQIDGHIVEVSPATTGGGARVSIQFDKLHMSGKVIPVVTNLRAIAGFMTVLEASVPEEAPSEGAPHDWLPTTQIGGDSVYGLLGPVMSGKDTSQVVGKSVGDGVLAKVNSKVGTKCRGEVSGNDSPQALWVFSTDACGTYGIEHLKIAHAGRTAPVGTIVLVSEAQNVKLRNGDGLLLRVD